MLDMCCAAGRLCCTACLPVDLVFAFDARMMEEQLAGRREVLAAIMD